MGNFSFKNILWKATFQVNLIRSIIAGIIWTIIAYAIEMKPQPGMYGLWEYMFILPVSYFCFFCHWDRIGVPYVALVIFAPALIIIPADPVMFIIHKVIPSLVPVKKYKFIEPSISIWQLSTTMSSTCRLANWENWERPLSKIIAYIYRLANWESWERQSSKKMLCIYHPVNWESWEKRLLRMIPCICRPEC